MKLIRYGKPGAEKPGLLNDNGQRYDLSGIIEDIDANLLASNGLKGLEAAIRQAGPLPEVAGDARLGPPIADPSKIICVGLNYAAHAAESGMEPPEEPVIFFKATSALCGPNDALVLPPNSTKTDWEVELAVLIGQRAQYVSEEDALDYVAGYMLHNDYSERHWQLERGGQWVKGKSFDTFAPVGPFLATPEEIRDPDQLDLWLKVNGTIMQQSNTSDFIFKVAEVISYLSHCMTLLPGDIISTGTPAGVGLGLKPPRYLKAGDVVELGIEGLGSSRQEVVAFAS